MLRPSSQVLVSARTLEQVHLLLMRRCGEGEMGTPAPDPSLPRWHRGQQLGTFLPSQAWAQPPAPCPKTWEQ